MRTPVITLWQPWASWVSLGWKTIETRTHERFAWLIGQRVGIHAGLKWDGFSLDAARPFLTPEQLKETRKVLRVRGVIVCTAFVSDHRECAAVDSKDALIDCVRTKRYGLILTDIRPMVHVPVRGAQGVWYYDIKETGMSLARNNNEPNHP